MQPAPGEYLCVRTYVASSKHQATVVKRDDALLGQDEVNARWPEVMAAIKAELETWVDHKCISRKQRSQARNIIDVKWVLKWKHQQEARSVTESQEAGPAKTVRVIRARLTIRGFKDMDAQGFENYAGASQRCSQRILVSEAVRRGWDICTTDISNAFLQAVTYTELAEAIGNPCAM